MKLVDISGTKGGNVWKIKLVNLKQIEWTRISEACTGAYMNSRRFISLEANIVKDEKGYLVAGLQTILKR